VTEASTRDAHVVIFLHIGKTAGTTLRQILGRQYRGKDILLLRNRPLREARDPSRLTREGTIEQFAALPEADRERPSLIMGHTIFGLHEHLRRPATYFTLLRDPVALTISQYTYIRRNANHPLHAEAKARSLVDYVTSGITLETDNSQTRALAGDRTVPFGACSASMLERAQANVEGWFAVVGLVERFDGSLLLLQEAFGWRDPFYVPANVSASGRSPASDDVRTAIAEQNHLDVRLYAWAEERFRAAVLASPGFEERLERFQRANRRRAPLGRLGQRSRQLVRNLRTA
jgi:hypothetical protein